MAGSGTDGLGWKSVSHAPLEACGRCAIEKYVHEVKVTRLEEERRILGKELNRARPDEERFPNVGGTHVAEGRPSSRGAGAAGTIARRDGRGIDRAAAGKRDRHTESVDATAVSVGAGAHAGATPVVEKPGACRTAIEIERPCLGGSSKRAARTCAAERYVRLRPSTCRKEGQTGNDSRRNLSHYLVPFVAPCTERCCPCDFGFLCKNCANRKRFFISIAYVARGAITVKNSDTFSRNRGNRCKEIRHQGTFVPTRPWPAGAGRRRIPKPEAPLGALPCIDLADRR